MMTIIKTMPWGVAAALGVTAIAGMAAAQTPIANPNDEVNQHFAVATKLFGKDQVQLHAFQDGDDGSRHKVYNFNCTDQTYNQAYDSDVAPGNFPLIPEAEGSFMQAVIPFGNATDVVAPLAAHACGQYGIPLPGFDG